MKGLKIVEVTPQSPDPEAELFTHFIALAESIKAGAVVEIAIRYPLPPPKKEEPRLFVADKG